MTAVSDQLILLDFWGVIGIVQTTAHQSEMAVRAGAVRQDFTAAYWAHRPLYDSGMSAHDYWANVLAEVGVVGDDDMVSDLVWLDTRSWSAVDPDMMELVGELSARGRKLALLSNAPRDLVAHASAVVGDFISEPLFSCEVGFAKPSAEIYVRAIEALAVPAGGILFIDDSIANVEAARSVGMSALHHQSVEQTRRALLGEG